MPYLMPVPEQAVKALAAAQRLDEEAQRRARAADAAAKAETAAGRRQKEVAATAKERAAAAERAELEKELLERLNSVATHGRPGPCPRCNSILHVVSDDDGLRLECRKWTMQQGGRKPCGVCQWLDPSSAADA